MFHFNPATFWMSQAVTLARLMQFQQEFALRMLATVAGTLPRDDAARLAAEAEAMKAACPEDSGTKAPPARPRKPAARAKPAAARR